MIVPTIHTEGCPAVMILLTYLSLLSVTIITLFKYQLRIKFW